MADEVERFGASIERGLLARFDAHLTSTGYSSRSAALADLMREVLSRSATQEDPQQAAMGTLTLFYDHTRKDLADRLSELGHDHHEVILTTLHFHLDHERCMEVVALRGTVAELRHFADHVLALRGVLHAQLVLTADEPRVGRGEGGASRQHSHPHRR